MNIVTKGIGLNVTFYRQFKKEWENKNFEEYEVKYLIVAGQWLNGCKDFESIMKIMNG